MAIKKRAKRREMRSKGFDREGLRTWIEVDQKALRHNLFVFRRLVPPACQLMAVAKSNAYGHGLYDFAPVLDAFGADWFGVDSIVEAVSLREKGIQKPILVLGYTLPSRFHEAVRHKVSLTISSFESLRALADAQDSKKIKIHFKVDTGMYRQGFLPGQIRPALQFLQKNRKCFDVEGIYTHFATAKDPYERNFTLHQIEEFEKAVAAFQAAGFSPIRHACATAGTLNFPEAHYDMVRIGIGLMGLWPSFHTKCVLEKKIQIKPALSWRTLVSEVKELSRGTAVGYDVTETLSRDSIVGVCPIGYWHGFPLSLSRVGEVLIRGHRAKVLGKISMDMMIVDLTDIPGVGVGDVVTVVGRDRKDKITACEVALKAGVSHYEFLTRLNPLIQKFYIG